MKKLILIGLIIFGINSGCVTPSDDRLFGTWVSDKERTMAILEHKRPLTDRQKRWFNDYLGKLKMTYTRDKVISEWEGEISESYYTVVTRDKDSVTIKALDDEDTVKLNFEGGTSYWLYSELGDYIEYFKKVSD